MSMKDTVPQVKDLSAEFSEFGLDRPTAKPLLVIDVEISAENLFSEYSKMFILECAREEPLLAKEVKLTSAEILKYCEYLVYKRVEIVNETITDFHKVRQLYLPFWIEECLAHVGKVWIRELGFLLTPVYDAETISYEEARIISDRLSYFAESVDMANKVMPRATEGNADVMSLALIAAEVSGMNKRSTPRGAAISRFLGLKLLQESAFAILYRVNYGDVKTVATAGSTRKMWFGK